MKNMWMKLGVLWVMTLVAACATEREITRAVIEEPRYCYSQFVGRDGIACYATPRHADGHRLVGYTGPAPGTYPKPAPQPPAKLYAPDMVSYWVKDAELIPESAPVPPGRKVAPPPARDLTSRSLSEIPAEPLNLAPASGPMDGPADTPQTLSPSDRRW
ncbi:MAG: hypothetical protein RIB59_13365 [Rhodospirillales bacterium]